MKKDFETEFSRGRSRAAAATALVAAALLCGPATAQQTRQVSFGLPTPTINATYCVFPVAQELGFFAEEGLSVDIHTVTGSVALAQMVLTGRVNIGAVTPEPTFQLLAKGHDLVFTYNLVRAPTGGVIATLADSPIKSIEEFRGKKLGAQSLAAGDIPFTNSILSRLGIDPKQDITYLAVGVGAQAAQALKSRYVDGLVLWDSAYAQIENLGIPLKYFYGPDLDKLFSTQLVVRKDTLNNDPDLVRGFGRAVAKATVVAQENPEACVRILWKRVPASRSASVPEEQQLKNDVAILAKRLTLMIRPATEAHGLGYYDKGDLVAWNKYAAEAGMIEKELPDVEAIYTNAFVSYYNDFDRNSVKQKARSWAP